ncbi:hypothetical protein FQZ97_876670 [compost metagenome]
MSKAWEWAPPTLQQELERKSFETLDWLIASAGLGKLSEAQFSTGLDTLFMAVNGLVRSQEFIEVMSAAQKEIDVAPAVRERRVFIGEKGTLVLSWLVGSLEVKRQIYVEGRLYRDGATAYDSYAEAKAGLAAAAQLVASSGFMEI